MADLTITALNVAPAGQCSIIVYTAGETLTHGQVVYKKASDGRMWLADADAAATAEAVGIAFNGAAAGESVAVAVAGPVDVGATLTVGTTYVVSGTAGAIAPIADLTTGDFITILGTASAAGKLPLKIDITGIAKP